MAPCSPQTLDDLLADPLIQAVMRADHVEPAALKGLLNDAAERTALARARGLAFNGAQARGSLALPAPGAFALWGMLPRC